MILDIFKDSFKYSSESFKKLISLGFLVVLGQMIIFPVILLEGYYYRVTKVGVHGLINGDDPLPELNEWATMFIQGLKMMAVNLAYALPGLIVLGIIMASIPENALFPTLVEEIGSSAAPSFLSVNPTTIGALWIIFIIPIVIWLISYLFATVATTHMIYNDSLKSAFNLKEIVDIIKSIGVFNYIKYYIGYVILYFGTIITALLLILIFSSLIGLIVMTISSSYYVGFSVIFGLTYFIYIAISVFIIEPFMNIFNSRAIALLYNMRDEI